MRYARRYPYVHVICVSYYCQLCQSARQIGQTFPNECWQRDRLRKDIERLILQNLVNKQRLISTGVIALVRPAHGLLINAFAELQRRLALAVPWGVVSAWVPSLGPGPWFDYVAMKYSALYEHGKAH